MNITLHRQALDTETITIKAQAVTITCLYIYPNHGETERPIIKLPIRDSTQFIHIDTDGTETLWDYVTIKEWDYVTIKEVHAGEKQ